MDPKNPEDIKRFMDLYKENPGADVKEMIIYGVLANQNMSGYDLYKIMEHKANVLGSMMKASKQSVYNILNKMEKDGYCEVAEVVTDTNRPNKSLYTLTEKGRERLNEMVRQEMKRPPVVFNNVAGVIGLSQGIPREELRESIVEKIDQLEYMIAVESLYINISPGPLLRVMAKSKVDAARALLASMKEALEVIENNDYDSLFQWPDMKKEELYDVIFNKEQG